MILWEFKALHLHAWSVKLRWTWKSHWSHQLGDMESAGGSSVQTRPTVDAAVINDTLPPYSFDRLVTSIRVEAACLAICHVIFISPDAVGE
jgi:hypothetical protein